MPTEATIGDLGRALIGFGILLLVAGGGLLLAERFGLPRLPGDVVVKRGPVTFVFPIATSILLSIVLTVLLNLWFRRG